jgi:hypothetical protein
MIKVIDNFISKYDFNILSSSINDIPWFFSTISNGDDKDELLCEELNNFHFTHLFYKDYQITSDKCELIVPIIQKLDVRALVKIKANLTPRTNEIIKHCLHTDLDYNDSYTAVYYANSNDGYTLFEDGTKIESIENRIVIFPSNMKHTGTTCTNQKNRIVINFNYF